VRHLHPSPICDAAVVAGIAILVIGVVLLYRWGRDEHRASTSGKFVLPAAVTITGAVLVAGGAALMFVPSSSDPVVGQVGNLPGASRSLAAPSIASSESAGGATSTGSTRAPVERRKGPVVLTDGYAFDLDSRDDDWNIARAEYVYFAANLDLRLFTLLDVQVGIVKVAPSAGYFDCVESAGRQTEIAHDNFFVGDTFCVETDEGRWARVVITSKEIDNTYSTRVAMDVVVWERHGT